MRWVFDADKFARLIRVQRGSKSLREASEAIAPFGNVSASTLCRVEACSLPDLETVLTLCQWLQVSPAYFFADTTEERQETPDVVTQIRADDSLEPVTRNVLAVLVAAGYEVGKVNVSETI